jgi:prepilin-type processing-associated H-X9-DG protein
MYVHDNSDALPPNNSERHGWIQMGVSNAWGNSWVWGNAQHDTNTANIEQGVLYADVPGAKVYACPADHSTVIEQPGLRRFRSYSADTWLNAHIRSGTFEDAIDGSPINLTTAQQLLNQPPARIFVFIDEHPQSIGDGIFGLPVPWFIGAPASGGEAGALGAPNNQQQSRADNWWGASVAADRHSQGCNLSFADGHTAHFPWQWPKRGMPEGDFQGTANALDEADFQRLEECAPKP